jgi:uncharacterized protein (UPF0332 family)
MSRKQGHVHVLSLLDQGCLGQISEKAADGGGFLRQARQSLTSAECLADKHPAPVYTLAYTAARQALTALLIQQGLRVTSKGGHSALSDAIIAQFGEGFELFDAMRRRRNQIEYPESPRDLQVSKGEALEAIEYARLVVREADNLLPKLKIWS